MGNSRLAAVIIGVAMLGMPSAGLAASFVSQDDVFSPQVLSEPTADTTYYGELRGHPHTFVFSVATTTPVRYQTATARTGEPVSLLLVAEAARGVTEVARQTGSDISWQKTRDNRLGVRLLQAPVIKTTLPAGVYRLEVSNPDNTGRYQLQIGAGSSSGFWQSLRESFVVHAFYGTWFTAVFTWRVLLLLLLVMVAGWLFRKRSTHA